MFVDINQSFSLSLPLSLYSINISVYIYFYISTFSLYTDTCMRLHLCLYVNMITNIPESLYIYVCIT